MPTLENSDEKELVPHAHILPSTHRAFDHSLSLNGMLLRGLLQFIVMIAILFAGFYGMNVLIAARERPPPSLQIDSSYAVDAIIAERGHFNPSFKVYGEVQASRTAELRSLVAGRIEFVNPALRSGAKVKKGDELLRVDRFEWESNIRDVETKLSEIKARIAENEARIEKEIQLARRLGDQLVLAANDLDRISSLGKGGTATAKQVEDRSLVVSQRQQQLEQSEFAVNVERAKLDQLRSIQERHENALLKAQRSLKDTVLRAPFDGIVSQHVAAVGSFVGLNDPVVSMYDTKSLEVRFTLTNQRFGRIQHDATGVVDRPVEVVWNVGDHRHSFRAVIDRLGAAILADRGGIELVARLKSAATDGHLRPGAFVEVIVPDRAYANHFQVPETAIYFGDTLYVIVGDTLQGRKVSVKTRNGSNVIVSGDLQSGAKVLTTRIAEISNGLKVRANIQTDVDRPK